MGLDITYIAGKNKVSFRLPPSDIDILSFLRDAGFANEVEAIFGTSDFGETTQIDRETLLKSATYLVESIRANPELLPYTYSLKVEVSRGSGMYSEGGGGVSGFHIGGILHYIEAGLNKCELSKGRQIESDKWEKYDPQDVRHLKVIKTDENDFFGDITIYKKRKPQKLLRNLEQIRSFLSKTEVKTVGKVLC